MIVEILVCEKRLLILKKINDTIIKVYFIYMSFNISKINAFLINSQFYKIFYVVWLKTPMKNMFFRKAKINVKNKLIKKSLTIVKLSSDSAGARTQDPILKRDVLYQLSYWIKNKSFFVCGCKYNSIILISKCFLKKKEKRWFLHCR